MSNRQEINQKTEFNRWSISYLQEIFQCSKCKKRNTLFLSSKQYEEYKKLNKLYQNCSYCGNPNFIKTKNSNTSIN